MASKRPVLALEAAVGSNQWILNISFTSSVERTNGNTDGNDAKHGNADGNDVKNEILMEMHWNTDENGAKHKNTDGNDAKHGNIDGNDKNIRILMEMMQNMEYI